MSTLTHTFLKTNCNSYTSCGDLLQIPRDEYYDTWFSAPLSGFSRCGIRIVNLTWFSAPSSASARCVINIVSHLTLGTTFSFLKPFRQLDHLHAQVRLLPLDL